MHVSVPSENDVGLKLELILPCLKQFLCLVLSPLYVASIFVMRKQNKNTQKETKLE